MKIVWTTLCAVVLGLFVPTFMTFAAQKVLLGGGLDDRVKRSAGREQPVYVYLDGDIVYVQFFREVGDVEVVLMDDEGEIITEDLIDTAVSRYMSIAIPENSGSNFTIKISNDHGEMHGSFSLD